MIEMYLEMSDAFFYTWCSHMMHCTKAFGLALDDMRDMHSLWMSGGEL